MKKGVKSSCGFRSAEDFRESLKKDAANIVKKMESYSKADQDKRRREITAAFAEKDKK